MSIITSLVAIIFCGYNLIYDETYGVINEVIYEVIMRKFRALMETFWDMR